MPNKPKPFRPAGRCSTRSHLSAAARGYDRKWRKLQAAFLAANPLCVHCESQGRLTTATQVDHKIPFRGTDDPRRLEPDNLQSLCASCHSKKTAAQKGRS